MPLNLEGRQYYGEAVRISGYEVTERYSTEVACGGTRFLFTRVGCLRREGCGSGRIPEGTEGVLPSQHSTWTTRVRRRTNSTTAPRAWGASSVALPASWHRMSHNFAVICHAGKLVGFGGRAAPPNVRRFEPGIFVVRAEPSHIPAAIEWSPRVLAINGSHPGCVERRFTFFPPRGYPLCEFDGRLSAVNFDGRIFLYTRANTMTGGGGRNVQVTSSADGGQPGSWSPFELVRFRGGKLRRVRSDRRDLHFGREMRGGVGASWDFDGFDFATWALLDIYYFVVFRHGDRVAALFPGVFALAGSHELRGGVFFALSSDGREFSPPAMLHASRIIPYAFRNASSGPPPLPFAKGSRLQWILQRECFANGTCISSTRTHKPYTRPTVAALARAIDHPSGWESAGNITHITIEQNVSIQRVDAASVPTMCRYEVPASALARASAFGEEGISTPEASHSPATVTNVLVER